MTSPLTVHTVPGFGAEDVLVGRAGPDEGAVFTGTDDGSVLRISHDGRSITRVGATGGRPLGLEHLGDGRLLVCDAHRGLLVLDPASGAVEPLVSAVGGRAMRFCNNAAVATDGTVYFTDSSLVHGIDDWEHDFARRTCTGRLLRRAPDGEVEVLLSGLAFANGVALAADGSWVAVAETAARRVVRLWLGGEREGESETFADDLSGYPDNLATGADGAVWVALASPRDPVVELIHRSPMWVRRAASSLPEAVRPSPKRRITAVSLDPMGAVVREIDVTDSQARSSFHMVTGVREHDGRLWLGSLQEGAIAVLDL